MNVGFRCDCTGTGFEGDRCENDVDECALDFNAPKKYFCVAGTCDNTRVRHLLTFHAHFIAMQGSYRCHCEEGFIGERCAHADPCLLKTNANQTQRVEVRLWEILQRIQSTFRYVATSPASSTNHTTASTRPSATVHECSRIPTRMQNSCSMSARASRASAAIHARLWVVLLGAFITQHAGGGTSLERATHVYSGAYSWPSPFGMRCRVHNSAHSGEEQESDKVRSFLHVLLHEKITFRGQYSPSRQEMTTTRQHQMAYILKPPPQEGLI